MGKDLSFIWVGGREKPEYKHQVNWTNLECTEDEYYTNIPQTVYSKDVIVKEKYYLRMTTKELIYNELEKALQSIYYDKEDKKDLQHKDKIKSRELKLLKKYYEQYTNKNNTIIAMSVKQTSKKMKELNTNQHILEDFDKSIVSGTYDFILNDIIRQINVIEKKKKKISRSQILKECHKNITALLKRDYENQKKYLIQREEQLKKDKEILHDKSQIKYELEKIKKIKSNRNLKNFNEKAKNLLFENNLYVDINHK